MRYCAIFVKLYLINKNWHSKLPFLLPDLIYKMTLQAKPDIEKHDASIFLFIKNYWWFLLIILLALILAVVFIFSRFNAFKNFYGSPLQTSDYPKTTGAESNEINNYIKTDLPACDSQNSQLTVSPVSIANITDIAPLGNFNPQGGHVFPTEHIYFYLKKPAGEDFNVAPIEVPLYAPADIWITSIRGSEHLSENPIFIDYGLEFYLCSGLQGLFAHVSTISAEMAALLKEPYQQEDTYEAGGKSYRMFEKAVNIKVKAGEQIGTVGGRAGQNALDLSFYDFGSAPLAYANPSRWYGKLFYVVCALDYYSEELKPVLEAKLGYGKPRTIKPLCGEVNQDISGSAQGVWFVKGTTDTYPEDPHITLAHDNFDPGYAVFSIGRSLANYGLDAGVYSFTLRDTGLVDRDFKDVKPDGNIYCYDVNQNYQGRTEYKASIQLQLTDATTLRMGTKSSKCGSSPWNLASFLEFER